MILDPTLLLDLCKRAHASKTSTRLDNRAAEKATYKRRLAAWNALTKDEKRISPLPRRETFPVEPALLGYTEPGISGVYVACEADMVADAVAEVMGKRSQAYPAYTRARRAGPRSVDCHVDGQWLTIEWSTGRRRIPMVPCRLADADLQDAERSEGKVAA